MSSVEGDDEVPRALCARRDSGAVAGRRGDPF